jgi:serine/threonine protein kinase
MDEKFSERYVFERKWTINRIILPVCNALAQAHSANIYYRDFKPDNIMYTTSIRSEKLLIGVLEKISTGNQ